MNRGIHANQDTLPVYAGVVSDATGVYTRIGSFMLGFGDYAGSYNSKAMVLRVIAEVTNALSPAEFRLYDVVGASVAGADPILTTDQLTPTALSVDITAILTEAPALYELQMRVATAPDIAICSHASILVRWADF
jgi:hypothetical protein